MPPCSGNGRTEAAPTQAAQDAAPCTHDHKPVDSNDSRTQAYEKKRDKKIRAAKRAARSELSVSRGEWTKNGYADRNVCSIEGITDNVPRVHCSELTIQKFNELFEKPRIPIVITGLCDSWAARTEWTEQRLRERFGNHKFKVGSDDDGYAVRLKLKHYLDYIHHKEHRNDDSPLYIFDGTFAEREGSKGMMTDYEVPEIFKEDLMRLAGERRRPPYRWFVMGPARSGSNLHIDPLATSAWNALLFGHKRWALFPPSTPKHLVLPRWEGLEREAVSWFTKVYPATQAPDWPTARPIDIIQGPGETVFVPGGWWHVVMNLDTTIAVTHNYASSANFGRVWRHTRKGRKKMSLKWLDLLRQQRADLAAVADALGRCGDDMSSTSSSSSSSSSSDSSSSSSDSSSDSEAEGPSRQSKRQKLDGEAQREQENSNGITPKLEETRARTGEQANENGHKAVENVHDNVDVCSHREETGDGR